MSNSDILSNEEPAQTAETIEPLLINSTTKAEQLSRAKKAIDAGESSLREAAEALALARQDFKVSQREIATAVGKSVGWVNRLLRWQNEGCVGTPFGPGSKVGRERSKRVQSTEQRAPRNGDANDAEASAEKRKAEYAKAEADPETRTPAAASPLYEFKSAVDHLFPKMDHDDRLKAVTYAKDKAKAS